MSFTSLDVGHGSVVSVERIVAIATPGSEPVQEVIELAQEKDQLLDLTKGRQVRSVIILDTHIALSSVAPETLVNRLPEEFKTLDIGYGCTVAVGRMVSVTSPDSTPMQRSMEDAKSREKLLDLTIGRQVRSVIVMDTHVVLSAVVPATLLFRMPPNSPLKGK